MSIAFASTISSSEKRILSSNPEDVRTPDTIINSTSFCAFSASFLRFVSSRRSSDDEIFLLANDSRNYRISHKMSAKAHSRSMYGQPHTTCSLSCQNSFSFALSRNGNSRTWCTKIYRRIGSSESSGEISPRSDLKGAPKRRSAVGELSSEISHFTCSETSSRLRSICSQRIHVLVRSPRQTRCFPGTLAKKDVLLPKGSAESGKSHTMFLFSRQHVSWR